MMYNNKLVVAIKSNGKVLREKGDTVYMPFGQEFTILVKNLNSVRALVRIEIDGTKATDNTSLIVPANGEVELERFIKAGNMKTGNRFKFIERTAGIEQHRGIKVDDGFIRVEFEFEQVAAPITKTSPYIWPSQWLIGSNNHFRAQDSQPKWVSDAGDKLGSIARGYDGDTGRQLYGSAEMHSSALNMASFSDQMAAPTASAATQSVPMNAVSKGVLRSRRTLSRMGSDEVTASVAKEVNDAGITVPGSVSNQEFQVGAWFPVDGVKHVMIVKMLGETGTGKQVVQAVTVKSKAKCTTCGHVNKATANFCSKCGTSLDIV